MLTLREKFIFNKDEVITCDRFQEAFSEIYFKTDFLFNEGLWRGKLVKPYSHSEFIISGHSDYEINDSHFELLKNISNGNLKKIFAINGNSLDNNIIPLPLGITNDCDDSHIHKIFGNLEQMEEISKISIPKLNKVYLNINVNTFREERLKVFEMFKNKIFVTIEYPEPTLEGRAKYLRGIKQHDFVLCPRGNGVDTHRLWETLYMGSIPIVIYSNVHKNLLDLPILFIKDWTEVTEDLLEQTLLSFNTLKWNMRKLIMDYWIEIINKEILKNNIVYIPVSIGELIDKITILEIKCEKIKDENKLKNIKNELEKLKIINTYSKDKELITLKNDLKDVNSKLWDIENAKRQHEAEKLFDENFTKLAREVYIFNDKRAEIKRKINDMTGSEIVEEKEFQKKKKAFYLGHLGMGDHILCNGLIRTLVEKFDEVLIICKSRNKRNVEAMFFDEKKIKVTDIDDDRDISPKFGCSIEKFSEITKGYQVFLGGCHQEKGLIYDFPYSFYDEVNIDRSNFWTKFKLPEFQESKDLYEKVRDIRYVFVHNSWSGGTLFEATKAEEFLGINKDEILIINPCTNQYNEKDKYYTLAQSFTNLPLFHYVDILKNSYKILTTDSSFFCLALQLELKSDECFFFQRPNMFFNMKMFYENFDIGKRKKFKSIH